MEKFVNYLSVACFAFLGGICRFWLNSSFSFWGTLIGNVMGCFLLALLTYTILETSVDASWLTTGLGTGFVGAFTTFSTFQLDTLKFLQKRADASALLYFLASMILGFLFAKLGQVAAVKLAHSKRGEE